MPRTVKPRKRPLTPDIAFTALPGPDRKRTPSPYCYRLLHRAVEGDADGCQLLWEVLGGRLVYQVALERQSDGRLCWHCTCPDAVYRGERGPHVCKHVRGLQELGRRPASGPAAV